MGWSRSGIRFIPTRFVSAANALTNFSPRSARAELASGSRTTAARQHTLTIPRANGSRAGWRPFARAVTRRTALQPREPKYPAEVRGGRWLRDPRRALPFVLDEPGQLTPDSDGCRITRQNHRPQRPEIRLTHAPLLRLQHLLVLVREGVPDLSLSPLGVLGIVNLEAARSAREIVSRVRRFRCHIVQNKNFVGGLARLSLRHHRGGQEHDRGSLPGDLDPEVALRR